MLSALLMAALLAAPAPTDTRTARLEAYILKRQPKAKAYAARLARAIIVQSKRVGLDPAVLAAVGWVESRWLRTARGSAQERGIWQLMRSDVRLSASWAKLRPTAPAWRMLSPEAVTEALSDVVTSTYLAADELAGVIAWCKRAGHRIGRGKPPVWIMGPDGVHRLHSHRQYHSHPVDRAAHHQSGGRMPPPGYLRALRYTYKQIRKVLNGK